VGWAEVEREYPVPIERLWALLSDTATMLQLDPLLVSYEPDGGPMAAGRENEVRAKLGPFTVGLRTLTERLDPPHGASFVSVRPRYPVRVRTQEWLEPTTVGCRYRVHTSASATLPVIGHVAAVLVPRRIARTRRVLLERLARHLDEHTEPTHR
jgi:hypothetical protein